MEWTKLNTKPNWHFIIQLIPTLFIKRSHLKTKQYTVESGTADKLGAEDYGQSDWSFKCKYWMRQNVMLYTSYSWFLLVGITLLVRVKKPMEMYWLQFQYHWPQILLGTFKNQVVCCLSDAIQMLYFQCSVSKMFRVFSHTWMTRAF